MPEIVYYSMTWMGCDRHEQNILGGCNTVRPRTLRVQRRFLAATELNGMLFENNRAFNEICNSE